MERVMLRNLGFMFAYAKPVNSTVFEYTASPS